ncbi:ARF GTPase-activating protein GIT1 [Liparis tanakae]|uniref:ARF GTPase-activating protein GIT1 n=1 Tax=Liparis tanakae TaxID=230148 RepID=A0A4Z2E4N0_9TELE|nr:ARF GTPase-activating protein GIT1 [Liparis tanakae]
MDSSDLSDGPITLQEYLEVKKALASSEAKVQQLMKVNNNLSEELRRLQKEVGGKEGRREGGKKRQGVMRGENKRRAGKRDGMKREEGSVQGFLGGRKNLKYKS